jgi:hypothetical protein
MNSRHDELLRESLRQFLIFTDHTKQRRQALFIHQQVHVSSLLRLVDHLRLL